MRFTNEDDRLDEIFSALAHPIRRALLARLANGTTTVGELAEPFDVSLMAISKHLRVLERASLVQRESEGRYTRCRIEPEGFLEASAWLENHSRFWSSQFESFGEYLAHGTRRPESKA
jgi:DNA-binding transcriptional ArsR family regulator